MFSEISWFCSKECLITCSDEKFVYGVLTMLRFRCKFDYVYFCSLERRGYAISYGGCCWISSNRHVSSQGLLQKDIRSVSVHWRFSCDPHNAIYAFKVFVVARGKVKILKSENRQPWEMHREIQFQLTENMQRRFCTPFPPLMFGSYWNANLCQFERLSNVVNWVKRARIAKFSNPFCYESFVRE